MPYITTNAVIDALSARLRALPLIEGETGGEKLLQRVEAFGARQLAEAMRGTFASEQRVCFIVPGGDEYSGSRVRSALWSQRSTKLALLIADKSLDSKTAPLVGGPHNLGILAIKDRIVANLVEEAFTGPDLCFEPMGGDPLVIAEGEKSAGNLGRECWMQWLGVHAGSALLSVP